MTTRDVAAFFFLACTLATMGFGVYLSGRDEPWMPECFRWVGFDAPIGLKILFWVTMAFFVVAFLLGVPPHIQHHVRGCPGCRTFLGPV